MVIYAGIDEAGYGPLFGPLCVACTSFSVPEDHVDGDELPSLWRLLRRAVCRRATDSRRRIAVEDSKLLKGANGRVRHPLADLERGVLAFLSTVERAGERSPASDTELFDALKAQPIEHPWYASEVPLPLAGDIASARINSSRLRRALAEADLRCTAMRCETVDAGAFNRGVRTFGNKAGVNMHHALRHAEQIRRLHPTSRLEIVIDRHGGRIHYRRHLQDTWPDARLRVEQESERHSRYQLTLGDQVMRITFVQQAEASHLPAALASMTAKYVRELLMLRLNRYFRQELPELKPTAGYFHDGRRFLRDIEPVIRRLELPRVELIRDC